jgi:hypothetical protein
MQKRTMILYGLVGLNAVLALPLISRDFHPAAANAAARAWADYLTVSGNVAGGPDQVVLVVDMTHDELGAMNYDDTTHHLQVMNPIDLAGIFRSAETMPPSSLRPGGGPAPANPAQPAPGTPAGSRGG